MDDSLIRDLASIRAVVTEEAARARAPRPWWAVAGGLVLLQLGVVVVIVAAWSALFRAPVVLGRPTAALALAIGVATVMAVRPGGGLALRVVAVLGIVGAAIGEACGASARPHVVTILGEADCIVAELGASVLPALAMLVVLRGFAFSWRSAVLGGLAVACTGVLVLDLTCPIGTLPHVVIFHLVPSAVAAGALALLRSRVASRSFVP